MAWNLRIGKVGVRDWAHQTCVGRGGNPRVKIAERADLVRLRALCGSRSLMARIGSVLLVAGLVFQIVGCGDSVFDLGVGDCLNEPSESEVSRVDKVPCDEAHDYEVFASVNHPAGRDEPFPLDLMLFSSDTGFEACLPHFEPYVGQDYMLSRLEIDFFYPSRESWEGDGDREFLCLLFDLDNASMTGSMRGSGY